MKRFLAFMFGIIFGVVFLLGSVGIAMYTAVTVVHPNEIYADIENYLGDLGDVSLLQAYYNILDLYNDKTGNISNEKLYSVGISLRTTTYHPKMPMATPLHLAWLCQKSYWMRHCLSTSIQTWTKMATQVYTAL
ncbi:MAG: hypothetical protein IKA29_03145 [Clostridia bacterium]|nr:hypothetical protein [Clostridia bacterium]